MVGISASIPASARANNGLGSRATTSNTPHRTIRTGAEDETSGGIHGPSENQLHFRDTHEHSFQ